MAALLGLAGRRSGGLVLAWVAVVLVSVVWHEMGLAASNRAREVLATSNS